jgi:DNA-3-methyladenine glycosylase
MERMRTRRGLTQTEAPSGEAPSGNEAAAERAQLRRRQALCGGPGRLCQALGVDRTLNGVDLTLGSRLWISPPQEPTDPSAILATPRIGISQAQDYLWRFTLRGDPFTSRGPTK